MNRRFIIFFATLFCLFAAAFLVILFAKGYRLDTKNGSLQKTGMIVVKSAPDGAKVYLDGKLVTATNATLSGIGPGLHNLKIVKEGYKKWEKEVSVFEELVTVLEAILIPQSPKLSPLTIGGASHPALSQNRDKIAYLAKNGERPGIWVLPLTPPALLNIFKAQLRPLFVDTKKITFSAADKIFWSSDDLEMLVQMNISGFYLLPLTRTLETEPEIITDPKPIFARWEEKEAKKRLSFLEKIDLSPDLKKLATSSAALWAPNNRKFLVKKEGEAYVEYLTYNLTQPLEVGEKKFYRTLRVPKEKDLQVSWYADSNHFMLLEDGETISLMRIDGTGKTEVFSGYLAEPSVSPTPDGSQLLILTSFSKDVEPNLYAISLR